MTAIIAESTETDQVAETDEVEGVREVDGVLIRPNPEFTLEDVAHEWSRQFEVANVDIDKVNVHLTESVPTISFGEVEVPASNQGLEVLGRHLGMPVAYLLKIPQDEQQFMIEHALGRAPESRVVIDYSEGGIQSLRDARNFYVEPSRIIDAVTAQMPLESPVRDHLLTPNELQLDAFVPTGFDRYVGGDVRVGDITQGGVRIFQDRKANTMPEAYSFAYRLWCTNGMTTKTMQRIEGRRGDLQDVFDAEFASIVRVALSDVTQMISSYYDMRDQKVTDPAGTMSRIARDHGLSDRVATALADRTSMFEDPTMFDLTNLVTNMANRSPLSRQARTLQGVGGRMVADHTARCAACHQTIAS